MTWAMAWYEWAMEHSPLSEWQSARGYPHVRIGDEMIDTHRLFDVIAHAAHGD